MSWANIMNYINVTNSVLISQPEKYHSMIEMCRLCNVVILIQTILSFVLSGKIMKNNNNHDVNLNLIF